MPNDGEIPNVGEENPRESTPGAARGVLLEDIGQYIQTRRAYLLSKRDGAESEFGKAKFIGALQTVNDFESMLKQLQLTAFPGMKPAYACNSIPDSIEELGGKLLERFGIPQCAIRDFRDNSWRDKLLSALPNKRAEILLMAQYARNPEIISVIIDVIRENLAGGTPAKVSVAGTSSKSAPSNREDATESSGGTCPYCGRNYKYAKSLAKHKETCAKKPRDNPF